MITPIADFVKNYALSDMTRLHMPGHKGATFLGCEPYDITEVAGADVLYGAEGIIRESEDNASRLFGTAHSFYSAEGSSLAIRAMLALAVSRRNIGSGRPVILAARNAHKTFIYACALLDLDVEWLLDESGSHLCSCNITAQAVEAGLCALNEKPAAVYLTSPDYLGQMLDIRAISDVCRKAGVLLLVDNAHGAYLQFLKTSLHPIALGADLCCDSAHKTLPVLTGGAYLHISKAAPAHFLDSARSMLALFASTSPSYLILQSLDLCNRYLSDRYPERLEECIQKIATFRKKLRSRGFCIAEGEPLKLVVNACASGYTGTELAAMLKKSRIECEYSDEEYLVMMFTPETRPVDYARLDAAFDAIPVRAPLPVAPAARLSPQRSLSIRSAVFCAHSIIPVSQAQGRICASPLVSCPPAIPIAVSGERITPETIALFKRYGVEYVEVVEN